MKKVLSLVVLLLILYIPSVVTLSDQARDDLYKHFLDLYKRTVNLAKQGIDVSDIFLELKEVHTALKNGDIEYAKSLLNDLKVKIEAFEKNAHNIVLWNNVIKSAYIAALASIPIIVYVMFPRLYLYIWYRTRRKWVVKIGHTR